MSDAEIQPVERKKGRPSGKRGTFTFRVTPALRTRLEAAASAMERPVSEEVERRLERSFEDMDLLLAYFGKSETLKLSHAISMLAREVEVRCGKDWTKDIAAKMELRSAIMRFFDIYFTEQDGSAATIDVSMMGRGYSAAEGVAKDLGLKSKGRDDMMAFMGSPEAQEALGRFMRGEPWQSALNQKKD